MYGNVFIREKVVQIKVKSIKQSTLRKSPTQDWLIGFRDHVCQSLKGARLKLVIHLRNVSDFKTN